MKNKNGICKCGNKTKFIDNTKGYAKFCSNECKYKYFPLRSKKHKELECKYCSKTNKSKEFCNAKCRNSYEISKYKNIEDFILNSPYKKDKYFLKKYSLEGSYIFDILNKNTIKFCRVHDKKLKFISIRDGYAKCAECNKIKGIEIAKNTKLNKRDKKFDKVDNYILKISKKYKEMNAIRPKDIAEKFNVSTSYVTKFIKKNNLSYILNNNQVFHINKGVISINKKAENIKGILYSIKIKDLSTQEEYFKVGITTNSVEKRFNKENIEIEVLEIYESSIKECFGKEQLIHRNNREYKFIPKNRISGYTECHIKQIKLEGFINE